MPRRSLGSHISDKGYVRISSGKHRHKYAHRLVGEVLIAEMEEFAKTENSPAGVGATPYGLQQNSQLPI